MQVVKYYVCVRVKTDPARSAWCSLCLVMWYTTWRSAASGNEGGTEERVGKGGIEGWGEEKGG